MSRRTFLPLEEKVVPSSELASGGVYDVFIKNSSWVWIAEGGLTAPQAPANEQRAFRKTWTNTNPAKVPITATMIATVDNYYALYINGILLQAPGASELWDVPFVFTFPLSSDTTVFAIRAINGDENTNDANAAGLRVAARISFSDGTSHWVFTGQDQTWKTKKLFEEGWEQPEFDDRDWEPVVLMPQSAYTSELGETYGHQQKLLPSTSAGAPSTGSSVGAASAGMLVGIFLLTAVLTAIITLLITRRRARNKYPDVRVQIM
ncbi:hypothetical protein DFP72DRAFT_871045 [Ephemerocybe angulata]|uniref:Uncharacterized protein n=1 Tax=Ephemerocybe angulata TaxID=980116 RepID=A0A8H6MG40_9AGAR|nr:hypothetical protein DFP72DRAFT_871045 [Tulosesus angulatus]